VFDEVSLRCAQLNHRRKSETMWTAVHGAAKLPATKFAHLRSRSDSVYDNAGGTAGAGFRREVQTLTCHVFEFHAPMEIIMKTTVSILFAATLMLSAAPANATVLDLSTMTCKQFVDSDKDTIAMVLTWMDGWYKGDSDEAIIDTEVFVKNAKKFGEYCGKNPTISIVNAAEEILGK
jgi:acid stress chaperone HdeB